MLRIEQIIFWGLIAFNAALVVFNWIQLMRTLKLMHECHVKLQQVLRKGGYINDDEARPFIL